MPYPHTLKINVGKGPVWGLFVVIGNNLLSGIEYDAWMCFFWLSILTTVWSYQNNSLVDVMTDSLTQLKRGLRSGDKKKIIFAQFQKLWLNQNTFCQTLTLLALC